MNSMVKTKAVVPSYSEVAEFPLHDASGREILLTCYSDGDLVFWSGVGRTLEFKADGIKVLKKALQVLETLPSKKTSSKKEVPILKDQTTVEASAQTVMQELEVLYTELLTKVPEVAQSEVDPEVVSEVVSEVASEVAPEIEQPEKAEVVVVTQKTPFGVVGRVDNGTVTQLFDENSNVTTIETVIPEHIEVVAKKVTVPKTIHTNVGALYNRSVHKEDQGWGANVINAAGEVFRYFYKTRDLGRKAEYHHAIGSDGRIA